MNLHSRETPSGPRIGVAYESFAVRSQGKSTVEPILTLGLMSIYTFKPEYLGYGQPTRLRPDTANAIPCINEALHVIIRARPAETLYSRLVEDRSNAVAKRHVCSTLSNARGNHILLRSQHFEPGQRQRPCFPQPRAPFYGSMIPRPGPARPPPRPCWCASA